MYDVLLTLHITAASLTLGAVFLQSLMVVMALRLEAPAQAAGVATLQRRLQAFVYYPLLAVTLATGLWIALEGDVFSEGKWLHWKLVGVVLLAGLGLLAGRSVRSGKAAKGPAMAVHVGVLLVGLSIVYLAAVKPF